MKDMNKTTIIYHPVYQKFTEYDGQGQIIQEGSFKIDGRQETIFENDRATVMFLGDNSKGVAKIHPDDIPNLKMGRSIAYLRARISSYKKLLRNKIKETHGK